MPQFSIIMPLYNKALYVRKAVESIVSQSYSDWELIVVDDGSNDGSAEIVAEITKPRIRLIRLENNVGVSMARNNGVAVSNGEYLCFLDADDWWEPTFLQEMAKLIAEFPNAGIYGTNYTIVNETKHKTRVAQIGVENGFEKGYINYCQAYAKTMYMPLWTGAVCIPRNVFEEMHGFPKGIKLGEDFLLWIRIVLKYKVVLLNKPLAYYNQDVDVKSRGVGRLHKPQQHMLWNLSDLDVEEKNNVDYKQLMDNLRVYGLLPYYLSKEYHKDALTELVKVDWEKQPKKVWRQYHQPLIWTRIIYRMMTIGSKVKQRLRK
jgi:glycosyltransferase involved in cell wall biosynthesis